MMNKLRMKALADFIANGREVEMGDWAKPKDSNEPLTLEEITQLPKGAMCNTAACAAGWCALMNQKQYAEFHAKDFWNDQPNDFAQGWLGLTEAQGEMLFFPTGSDEVEELGITRRQQKSRLLKVLRGEKPLTANWMLTP